MLRRHAVLTALAALPVLLAGEDTICQVSADYTISYGRKEAPIRVTHHFLLDCPTCLQFIARDFPAIKRRYIDTGSVHWTFHLDPVGLVNFQAIFCLSQLSIRQKKAFLTLLVQILRQDLRRRKRHHPALLMQRFMLRAGKPILKLNDLDFLEKTAAWDAAMRYLGQKNLPKRFPAFEIKMGDKRLRTCKKADSLRRILDALIQENKEVKQ